MIKKIHQVVMIVAVANVVKNLKNISLHSIWHIKYSCKRSNVTFFAVGQKGEPTDLAKNMIAKIANNLPQGQKVEIVSCYAFKLHCVGSRGASGASGAGERI